MTRPAARGVPRHGHLCAIAVERRARRRRDAAARALIAGRREVAACERALSRFDPQSDLSRLNRPAARG